MLFDRRLTILAAVLTLSLLLGAACAATRPTGAIITDASFGSAVISPNADGENDAATVHYRVRREADVSIYLEDGNQQRYYFRRDETRTPGEYSVLFSGIVDPYTVTGEAVQGTVLQRLIPNGKYTWVIEATDRFGSSERSTGEVEVVEADTELPDILEFTIATLSPSESAPTDVNMTIPTLFTPNRDGINDRVWINVYVPKESRLLVYLIDEEGNRIFIPEMQSGRQPGEAGRHSFEYDGGIDNGSDPPPDGTYQVLVESEDEEGQKVQATAEMLIQYGGVPLAEVRAQPVGDTVRFSALTILVGEVLHFELTVENYGDAPIRTTGPYPGHIYEQSDRFASTGFFEESGAWRVGIDCDTCIADYPWRWSLGSPETLTPIETNGVVHYYLMPGQRAVITGGIRLTSIIESRNPQRFWAGLIHEDVEIAPLNNVVDPHWIEILDPEE